MNKRRINPNKSSSTTLDSFIKRIKTSTDTEIQAATAVGTSSPPTLIKTVGNDTNINAETCTVTAADVEASYSKKQESCNTLCASDSYYANKHNSSRTSYDIGEYIDADVSDAEKYHILKNAFTPGCNFNFPFSEHKKNNKEVKCYLSLKHFDSFKWLTYSYKYTGLFCKFCALFAKFGGINRSTPLKKLVTLPLRSYSKLFGKDGDLVLHNSHKYHLNAIVDAQNFIKTFEDPQKDIVNILDAKRSAQIIENRKRLLPIIETIIFMGRQNIPLRGHKDYGDLTLDTCNTLDINEGNFRELLRFRAASGDDNLKNHLVAKNNKATYISSNIQSELIQICGNEILRVISENVDKSIYYSVIFDETTDLSHRSQMSLVVKYYDRKKNEVREDFVSFIDCFEESSANTEEEENSELALTGKVLSSTVLDFLKKHNFNLNNCVGIGTDTCSVMLSERKGAVTELQKYLPHALKSPCFSHCLNLSISKSCSVQDIRNSVGIMKEIISFFSMSAKRNAVLKSTGNDQLIKLCETRWTERHDSILRFKSSLDNILISLEMVSQWKDRETSAKAQNLSNSIANTSFIVSIHCLSYILAITLNLSKVLQSKSLDQHYASTLVDDVINLLKDKRHHADKTFKTIFQDIKECHEKIGIPIVLPRRVARQNFRTNIDVNDPEEYYKITIFIPLLDNLIQDLDFRFKQTKHNIFQLNCVIPYLCVKKSEDDILGFCKNVATYLSGVIKEGPDLIGAKLQGEMSMWKLKWEKVVDEDKDNSSLPNNALLAYKECDDDVFPIIKTILHILCVLPVSVSSAERSFSALKRLKTWLRTKMSQDRLVGLALLHIHRNLHISAEKILDIFSKNKKRRMDFVV